MRRKNFRGSLVFDFRKWWSRVKTIYKWRIGNRIQEFFLPFWYVLVGPEISSPLERRRYFLFLAPPFFRPFFFLPLLWWLSQRLLSPVSPSYNLFWWSPSFLNTLWFLAVGWQGSILNRSRRWNIQEAPHVGVHLGVYWPYFSIPKDQSWCIWLNAIAGKFPLQRGICQRAFSSSLLCARWSYWNCFVRTVEMKLLRLSARFSMPATRLLALSSIIFHVERKISLPLISCSISL